MKLGRWRGSRLFAAAILFSTNLAWFFIFHTYLLDLMLKNTGADTVFISVAKLLFYGVAVISGIVGSLITERMERTKFLRFWTIFGFLVTISVAVFQGIDFTLPLSILLGISFGLGFPAVQVFLTEATSVDSRGRVAGIVAFVTLIVVVGTLILETSLQLGLIELIIICASLKVASFPALMVGHSEKEEGKIRPWRSILFSTDFASYAIPWLIFNLANGIVFFGKLPSNIESVIGLGIVVEFFAAVFTALVGGLLADRNGRKQPMMFGLVMLGIGYALFGVLGSQESYLFYCIVDGAAWGLLVVAYMQVILGDLSSGWGSKERFYALGGIMIPFLTRSICQVTQSLSGLTVPANSLSAMLGIVTIVSVIPVWRAPETLPESVMRERKLREHVQKVGKLVEESRESE